MSESILVVDVAVSPRDGGTDAVYTYRCGPDGATVGDAFIVPLGSREVLGFAVAVRRTNEAELGFGFGRLRVADQRVAGLSVPEPIVEAVRFVADEYLCPITQALSVALPPGVRDRLGAEWRLVEGASSELRQALTVAQRETVRSLEDAGGALVETPGKKIAAEALRSLKLLRAKGLVTFGLRVVPFAEGRQAGRSVRLNPDAERIERFLRTEGKRKPAQALTLMKLQGTESSSLTVAEVRALAGVTDQTVRALLAAGLLQELGEEPAPIRPAPEPNATQQTAIDALTEAVRARRSGGFLLYGVTGSGKTEVYLRAAAESLRLGRPVLYLVPEIALTAQVIAQLRDRFGKGVAVLHSDLPPKERLENWMRVRSGEASVVLGPRSALFAPLRDIGLIILDEEHEASYKQENAPRYHTKRVAQFLGERFGAPLVLGSATPSLESYYEALQGRLTLLRLPERAAAASLPSVHLEDLRVGYRQGKPAMFTAALHERIEETLERGEQVILFLNRRAYSSFLLCRECGHRFACRYCAVTLSYHRLEKALRCHHCDHRERAPDTCPTCGSTKIAPMGMGTEKVEEAVAIEFPRASVDRLDRDVARRRGALEATFAGFRSGATNVLVGTQMVAKGLDFPNVTLVGVIAADVSLNIPDFRASERTFQLLSQVAGRAGRGRRPGHVVIQTFNPENVALEAARDHDFETFYAAMIEEREQAQYPPFVRLVNVLVTGEDRGAVVRASAELRRRLEAGLSEAILMGPTDCPIERIQNKWRRHLVVKLNPDADARPLGTALDGFAPSKVQVTIDVDPQSLA
ncbi:MAG: primosomal protein N' [Fimbriimonadaceae bacterium]|nr:primosomal protein N' [Fimbriimonadaceae bacterium]